MEHSIKSVSGGSEYVSLQAGQVPQGSPFFVFLAFLFDAFLPLAGLVIFLFALPTFVCFLSASLLTRESLKGVSVIISDFLESLFFFGSLLTAFGSGHTVSKTSFEWLHISLEVLGEIVSSCVGNCGEFDDWPEKTNVNRF